MRELGRRALVAFTLLAYRVSIATVLHTRAWSVLGGACCGLTCWLYGLPAGLLALVGGLLLAHASRLDAYQASSAEVWSLRRDRCAALAELEVARHQLARARQQPNTWRPPPVHLN